MFLSHVCITFSQILKCLHVKLTHMWRLFFFFLTFTPKGFENSLNNSKLWLIRLFEPIILKHNNKLLSNQTWHLWTRLRLKHPVMMCVAVLLYDWGDNNDENKINITSTIFFLTSFLWVTVKLQPGSFLPLHPSRGPLVAHGPNFEATDVAQIDLQHTTRFCSLFLFVNQIFNSFC